MPEIAICRRCVKAFNYQRVCKPRVYCIPCAELERKDTNAFNTNLARQKRHAARMNAHLAHEEMANA